MTTQCETCKHNEKRSCMYHGYPTTEIPLSCAYKLGVHAEEAMRNLKGTHIDVWTNEHVVELKCRTCGGIVSSPKCDRCYANNIDNIKEEIARKERERVLKTILTWDHISKYDINALLTAPKRTTGDLYCVACCDGIAAPCKIPEDDCKNPSQSLRGGKP